MASERFSRPSKQTNYMNPETILNQSNATFITHEKREKKTIQFSKPKSVIERSMIKPFGKAVDSIQNKNITSYGDDVYIEYNPRFFLGKNGILYINEYLKKISNAYIKNEPLDELILLKSEFTCETTIEENEKRYNNNKNEILDWWGDENINEKIKSLPYTVNLESITPKITVYDLISDVIDKLHIANTLIHDLKISICRNQNTQQTNSTTNSSNNKNIENNKTHNGLFAPIKRDKRTVEDCNMHAFDDNYSIRISNIAIPEEVTTYSIKDVLNKYIENIKYKISIPRNKETNQNKDFAFINFTSEQDMQYALNMLTSQRIFMDHAILNFEISKKK